MSVKEHISLEETVERSKERYIKKMNAAFSKVVELIQTSDKNLGPYGEMSKERNALFYTNPDHPIHTFPGHEEETVYGDVFIEHGREVYEQFDTDSVTFNEHSQADFITLQVPLHIVRAVVEKKARDTIDWLAGCEVFQMLFKTTEPNLIKMYTNEDPSTILQVYVNYAFPNHGAFENYHVSRTPHFVVEMKCQPDAFHEQAVNSSKLYRVPPTEMIDNFTAINERLLNPQNVTNDGKLPLQEALYNYVTQYALPQMKHCFGIK